MRKVLQFWNLQFICCNLLMFEPVGCLCNARTDSNLKTASKMCLRITQHLTVTSAITFSAIMFSSIQDFDRLQ